MTGNGLGEADAGREGFGRAILAALEIRAGELGYTTLHLDTTVDRMPARRLYLDAGYREVGRSAADLVYYEKQIGHRV